MAKQNLDVHGRRRQSPDSSPHHMILQENPSYNWNNGSTRQPQQTQQTQQSQKPQKPQKSQKSHQSRVKCLGMPFSRQRTSSVGRDHLGSNSSALLITHPGHGHSSLRGPVIVSSREQVQDRAKQRFTSRKTNYDDLGAASISMQCGRCSETNVCSRPADRPRRQGCDDLGPVSSSMECGRYPDAGVYSTPAGRPRRQGYDDVDDASRVQQFRRCPDADINSTPTGRPRTQMPERNHGFWGRPDNCQPQQVIDRRRQCPPPNKCTSQNSSPSESPPRRCASRQPPCPSPRSNRDDAQAAICNVCSEGSLPYQDISSDENMNDSEGYEQYLQQSSSPMIPFTIEQVMRDEENASPAAEVIARNFNLGEQLARERAAQAENNRCRNLCGSEASADDSSRTDWTSRTQNLTDYDWNSSMEPSSPRMHSTKKSPIPRDIVLPCQPLSKSTGSYDLDTQQDLSGPVMSSTMREPIPTEIVMPRRALNQNQNRRDVSAYPDADFSGPVMSSTMREPIPTEIVMPRRALNQNQNRRDVSAYPDADFSGPVMSSTMREPIPTEIVMPRRALNQNRRDVTACSDADFSGPVMSSTMREPIPTEIVMPRRALNQNQNRRDVSAYPDADFSGPVMSSTMREPIPTEIVMPRRALNQNQNRRDVTACSDADFSGPVMSSTMREPIPTEIVMPRRALNQNRRDVTACSDADFSGPIMHSTMRQPLPRDIVLPRRGQQAQNNESSWYSSRNSYPDPSGPPLHSTPKSVIPREIVLPRCGNLGNQTNQSNTTDMTWRSDMEASDTYEGMSQSQGTSDYGRKSNSNRKRSIPQPDEMMDEEWLRKLLMLQLDHLVKDSYCPGIIQETINGCENFNITAFDLVFGENTCIPDCLPAVEPITLLEAFQLRTDFERVHVNRSKNCRSAKTNDDDLYGLAYIDDHFSKQHPTELNRSIASLMKAETIFENLDTATSDEPSFLVDMSKGETMLPGGKPIVLTSYTGITTPKSI